MSGAPNRVYVARLAGMPVYDPRGDQVGKVRDVVVALRGRTTGTVRPRVLGLVVEVFGRRKVFLPFTRVTSIDAGQVITTGVVNMRRFEQRPGETLVLGELLDRQVTVTESRTVGAVFDVAMEQDRNRDWSLVKVALREASSRFGRKGQEHIVEVAEVAGLLVEHSDQGATNLLATLHSLRAPDLADVLEEMSPDDAADLIAELPPDTAEHLLALMEPDEAEDVRRLLSYEERTAGGIMTSEPVILPPDATVAEALALVRHPEITPSLAAAVYVCRPPLETPTGRFVGVAHIQRLLREPPSTLVSAVADNDIAPLRPGSSLDEVTRLLAAYNLVASPVVDDTQHLVGVVTVDDVLDHLLPQGWREGGALHGA